ncbi:hypothetical protein BH23CHL2_BH23CHL2_15280 [soil metagenome]
MISLNEAGRTPPLRQAFIYEDSFSLQVGYSL